MVILHSNYSNAQTPQLDPTQVYTTNNIVTPTNQGGPSGWINGVYQNNLTCWGWGDPGYCGPNAIVRPGNNINFSYGLTDLHQIQTIANVLPNSGTGLRVNGYIFAFTAKNGNGWDDGRVDQLSAYVNFYDTKGLVTGKVYDLNYKFNWTSFNFNETFANPYASKDLTNVSYGFVGKDNNFWAGPYGPEVNSVSFSLKYSVDPCFVNVLSSPSCPGYLDELKKLNTTSAQEPVQQSQVVNIVESAVTPIVSASIPQTSGQAVQVVQSPISSQNKASTSTMSTTKILSIVNAVQAQVASVEKTVIDSIKQEAQKSSESTQDQANIANNQPQEQNTITQQQNTQATTTRQTFLNTNQNNFSVLQPVNQSVNNTAAIAQTVTSNFVFSQKFQETQSAQQTVNLGINFLQKPQEVVPQNIQSSNSIYSLVAPQLQQVQQEVIQQTPVALLQQKQEPITTTVLEQKEVIGPNNLLQQFVENKLPLENVNQSQPTKQVNQAAKDSELATGITITNIAKQPQGFESYTLVLRDVPFYASTEVYRNQRTVDNQRAARALTDASDIRHKELVDLQYRR